jgi:hypothetical protein
VAAIILPDRWKRQPQGAVQVDLQHPLAGAISSLVVPVNGKPVQLIGRGLTLNGTLASAAGPGGVVVTNNAEKVSGGTANNFISLSPIATSAVSILFVGTRYSTPPTNNAAVAMCSRESVDNNGLELDLGNAFGNANLVYFYGFGSVGPMAVYCNGVAAVGNNPTNITVVNGAVNSIVATAEWHTGGGGHTVLAKAAGTGDFAYDVGTLLYATFNRVLSPVEALSLSANPWQIFKPRKRVLYFDAPSFPVLSSLTASYITSSGGRLTANA